MWKNILFCRLSYDNIKQVFPVTNMRIIDKFLIFRCRRSYSVNANNNQPKNKYLSNKLSRPTGINYVTPEGSAYEHQKKNISPGEALLLAVPLATFALGTWQVKRREWKANIIKDLESKMNEDPIELPQDLTELDNLEYRKVKVQGKFDHSKEVYLGPRSLIEKGGSASAGGLISAGQRTLAGHCVITPFVLSGSEKRILVNRGWVPTSSLLPAKRKEGQIEDEVELVGIVRHQQARGTFVPENKPHLKVYHYRDVRKMATKTDSLPVLLDATAESTVEGGPIGGQTNVAIRNEHMSYIITWYSLSALTSVMWCLKYLPKKIEIKRF